MRWRAFSSPQALGAAAAQDFALTARGAVRERGAFRVALSGGGTPKYLYRALLKEQVPWEQVWVYFSDERTVPPDSPDSNFKLAQGELLSKVAVPERQTVRLLGEQNPHQAARAYARELPEQLDLVLLGMGDDGHTASLFPDTVGLKAAGRVVANFVPKLDTWRLSFTFDEINAARARWLLVTGENKAEVLKAVAAGEGDFPVARVDDPVWYLDEAAAKLLE